jgi:NitT/TauT family transport system substrate-binding protein
MRRRWLWSLAMVVAVTAMSLGCSAQPAAQQQSLRLKVGVLPIVDALPMYVAEQEGYFADRKLEVELVLFQSALERDAALVAGQIDGELNDPISAALLNKDGGNARIVRLAYRGNESMPMMVVLASPNSTINSPAELKGVEVGISKNSIIEYATERLLQSAGLPAAEIKTTEVTKIPVRTEMLAKGQIQAATLPEPLASLAAQQGARVVIDDSKTGTGKSVITFSHQAVTGQAEAIRRFLAAYEEGVQTLAQAPNDYLDLMVDKAKVPDILRATFKVPSFPEGQLPTREDMDDVTKWMVEKGLLAEQIPYEKLVAEGLLPR